MAVEKLKVPFSTWTQVAAQNGFQVYQCPESADSYVVWCGNYDYVYETHVDVDDFITTYSGTHFSGAVDVMGYDDAIAHIVGISDVPSTHSATGQQVMSVFPTSGLRDTIVTHNWADPTSWYSESVAASGNLTPMVSGTTYAFPHTNIIDTYHGRIWNEDALGYRVSLYVDDVVKTEVDPHTGVGDYTVDYLNGSVEFDPTISTTATVSGNYNYENGSTFTVQPKPGTKLIIKNVEVQFSTDMELRDTTVFTAYGYVDVFAPQYTPVPYPAGTKIPINSTTYKSIFDFIDESNSGQPVLPPMSSGTWRGNSQGTIVFPWDYAAAIELSDAAGMSITIKMQNDVPAGGERVTVTFYGLYEDE
jgi:hypothetical protein